MKQFCRRNEQPQAHILSGQAALACCCGCCVPSAAGSQGVLGGPRLFYCGPRLGSVGSASRQVAWIQIAADKILHCSILQLMEPKYLNVAQNEASPEALKHWSLANEASMSEEGAPPLI